MASGGIDERQVSSNEEQEVFAGFTIEEIGDIRQAYLTRKNKTCFTMRMARLKTFLTYSRKKGEAIPMLSYTASVNIHVLSISILYNFKIWRTG